MFTHKSVCTHVVILTYKYLCVLGYRILVQKNIYSCIYGKKRCYIIYIYMYIHIYTYTYIHSYIHTWKIYVYTHVCVCKFAYIAMWIHINTYV
jgi:hypothetical protein